MPFFVRQDEKATMEKQQSTNLFCFILLISLEIDVGHLLLPERKANTRGW